MTTTRHAAVRVPSRRLARGGATTAAVVAALLLPLAGCSGEEEPEGTPPPGEIEDLGQPRVPTEWREGWCEARQAATRDEAVELLGEPTRENVTGDRTSLVWRLREEVRLSLVVDADGQVLEYRQSVADRLPEDVRADLACEEPAAG